MSDDFYDQMTEQSEVKIEIVRKYFWAWAKILIPQVKKRRDKRIGYVDLFAGKGRYNDGTKSTPILILERAISEPDISEMLVARFNDVDPENARSLEAEISAIPGFEKLKHKPKVNHFEVEDKLADKFKDWPIPTLFFLDPWGYKGLSQKLISAVLKPWGSDCIFFFNYNRINAALSNPIFTENMNRFFGNHTADKLRSELKGLSPYKRQDLIIKELKRVLEEMGGKFSQEFCFKDNNGTRTTHFLIGVSKNVKGYDLMKSIMANESSTTDQGIPSFEYTPKDDSLPLLPGFSQFDHLKEALLNEFAGRTITMEDVYKEHHIGKSFIRSNYKSALADLEAEGKITTDPPASLRRTGTFPDKVRITFPAKSQT